MLSLCRSGTWVQDSVRLRGELSDLEPRILRPTGNREAVRTTPLLPGASFEPRRVPDVGDAWRYLLCANLIARFRDEESVTLLQDEARHSHTALRLDALTFYGRT